jgi:hypothetical protein
VNFARRVGRKGGVSGFYALRHELQSRAYGKAIALGAIGLVLEGIGGFELLRTHQLYWLLALGLGCGALILASRRW